MKLPFSVEAFFGVFESYNLSVWPAQVLLFLIAVTCLVLLRISKKMQSIFFLLALLWLWMGGVYHFVFFSPINPAAKVFGTVFIIQALIFVYLAVQGKVEVSTDNPKRKWAGISLVGYALLIYPVLGYLVGHRYPTAPTFGVPCPTTIFTFGVLLFALQRIPWFAVLIPLLWSLVGFSAAISLSVYEDYGLFLSGIVYLGVTLKSSRPIPVT